MKNLYSIKDGDICILEKKVSIHDMNASETLNYWIEETFKFHGLMHEDNGILITNSTCS